MTHVFPPNTVPVPAPAARSPWFQRLQLRWSVSTTITELTREREDRILAEAAVRLSPGGWNIALLFRHH